MSGALRLKPSLCISCGKTLDAASCLEDGSRPKPGDITVCFYCGQVMAFDNDLGLRHLTEPESKEVENDERINHAVKLIRLALKNRIYN